MSASHSSGLFRPGSTALHRLQPQCKLVAAVLFVFVVVATPREQFWAYGLYAAVVASLAAVGRLGPAVMARRMAIELPFVAFAVFLPLIVGGDRVDLWFLTLSEEGLLAAWNILAKGTLGIAISVILTATTPLPELIRGLERLRVPRAFTSIMAFMIRYADVITSEMRRMKIARESRGHDPRWIWQARAIAHTAGTLFVRSYERGERVYLAMLSRGYDGTMPELAESGASRREWLTSSALPVFALCVAVSAWMVQA